MTLQEKINKKAEGFGKLAPVFLEGAKFALENRYINYQEQKPPFGVEVIAYHHKWVQYGKKITHWKPFIEPPKEEEIKIC